MSDAPTTDVHPDEIDPVRRLLTLGETTGFAPDKWPDYTGTYGIGPEHIPALLAMAADNALNEADSNSLAVWAPSHAWRALGQSRDAAVVPALLDMLRTDDPYEGVIEDFPHVFTLIGPPAIPCLAAFIADRSVPPLSAGTVMEALGQIASAHPAYRDECVATLTRVLAPEADSHRETSAWALGLLLDLKAVESIGAIRDAFARDAIECSISGDLEDAEIEFGLRKVRATPAPWYPISLGSRPPSRDAVPDGLGWAPDDPIAWTDPVPVRTEPKIGRNALCPCGSGKKYKKCCLE